MTSDAIVALVNKLAFGLLTSYVGAHTGLDPSQLDASSLIAAVGAIGSYAYTAYTHWGATVTKK